MAITTLNLRALNRSDTASSGQVVTATSATAADFQDASTGGLVKLVKTTISGTSTTYVDFNSTYITSAYNNYLIKGHMIPITDNRYAKCQLMASDSAVTAGGSYEYESAHTGSSTYIASASADTIVFSHGALAGNATTEGNSWEVWLNNPLLSTAATTVHAQCNFIDGSGVHNGNVSSGGRKALEVNNGIRLFYDSGNIAADSYLTLYGIVA